MEATMEMRKSNLVLPQGFVEMDREEMMYVEGGNGFPVALISIPINILICLNPAVGAAFGGITGLIKFGLKNAAKKATKTLVKTSLTLLAGSVGAIYAGAAAGIRAMSDDMIDQVVTIFLIVLMVLVAYLR